MGMGGFFKNPTFSHHFLLLIRFHHGGGKQGPLKIASAISHQPFLYENAPFEYGSMGTKEQERLGFLLIKSLFFLTKVAEGEVMTEWGGAVFKKPSLPPSPFL